MKPEKKPEGVSYRLRGREPRCNVTTAKYKKFVLHPKCAADYPDRLRLQDKLVVSLISSGQHPRMKNVNFYQLEYAVHPRAVEEFMIEIDKFGFRATEERTL
jgi:hypothetical protein